MCIAKQINQLKLIFMQTDKHTTQLIIGSKIQARHYNFIFIISTNSNNIKLNSHSRYTRLSPQIKVLFHQIPIRRNLNIKNSYLISARSLTSLKIQKLFKPILLKDS